MTPNFSIFRSIFAMCQSVAPTFDYVPNSQTHYPFIWIDSQDHQIQLNNELIGEVIQHIRLYGLRKHRKQIDQWVAMLYDKCHHLKQSYGYSVSINSFNIRVLTDHTEATPLLHYVVEVSFNYNK